MFTEEDKELFWYHVFLMSLDSAVTNCDIRVVSILAFAIIGYFY